MTFQGRSLVGLTDRQLAAVRWKDLSVVMQSAMNALNPVKSIGAQFTDAMRAHGVTSKPEIAGRSAEVLRMVGIDPVHLKSYPFQLSGGMRQRSMIAMAMLFTPDLVIMDEPTSALDVVAQRSLMVADQGAAGAARLRDHLRYPRHVAGQPLLRPADGDVRGPGGRARRRPARSSTPRCHPYSIGLLDAFPSIRGPRLPLTGIPGTPPDLARPPAGCRFAPRCPKVMDVCRATPPDLYQVGAGAGPLPAAQDGQIKISATVPRRPAPPPAA